MKKIWSVARVTMGWLMTLFGFTTLLPNIYDIKDIFSSLRIVTFSVWSVLLGVSGIGILMRQNWARVLAIYSTLFLILLRLSSKEGGMIEKVVFVVIVLGVLSFFLHKNVREQFKR